MVNLFGMIIDAAHGDSFAAKRMRKLTQRRAVDYTSTVVRYMQVPSVYLLFVLFFLLIDVSSNVLMIILSLVLLISSL